MSPKAGVNAVNSVGSGDGRRILQHAAPAPRDGFAQEEPNVEGHRRGGQEQHRSPRQPLRQHLDHRPGKMPEGHAEVPREGVLHVDQVLLPQRLVQPEGLLDLGPHLRRQVRVQGIEGGIVPRLRLHQEKRQRDDQEQGQRHLAGPLDQVSRHRGICFLTTSSLRQQKASRYNVRACRMEESDGRYFGYHPAGGHGDRGDGVGFGGLVWLAIDGYRSMRRSQSSPEQSGSTEAQAEVFVVHQDSLDSGIYRIGPFGDGDTLIVAIRKSGQS